MVSMSFDSIGDPDMFNSALAKIENKEQGIEAKKDGGNIAWLKLLQPLSNEVENGEGQPGDLYLEGVGVVGGPSAPVVVIPVGDYDDRKMFKGGNPKQALLCYSPDGITGEVQEDGDANGGYGGDCASCPMSVRKGGGRAPCTFSNNVHMFLPEFQSLGTYGFSNTGMPASGLIASHKIMAKGNTDGFPIPAPLAAEGWGKFGERLISVSARNANGNYHKPQVNRLSPGEFAAVLVEAGIQVSSEGITAAAATRAHADDDSVVEGKVKKP